MKDRISQTITRLEKDLEVLSFKAQNVLTDNGEYLRELNDLINAFEEKKADIESRIEDCKDALAELNEIEAEKRAQLRILNEIFD